MPGIEQVAVAIAEPRQMTVGKLQRQTGDRWRSRRSSPSGRAWSWSAGRANPLR
ncbi:hypothetical protein PATSB16_17530 [Pandoraea thiooxydans]|nr:hypothetical protein PATSB16_17530 [Pandoraea thiooxydans]